MSTTTTTDTPMETTDDNNNNNNNESSSSLSSPTIELPSNRFALELEFVQSLASPAYLHYLATLTTNDGISLLLCPKFKEFLKYLHTTWSIPEYCRYITYPHSLYFLELLIKNDSFCRELAQVSFRNFCHQQQYYAWQNRFITLYGSANGNGNNNTTTTGTTGGDTTTGSSNSMINDDNNNNIDQQQFQSNEYSNNGNTTTQGNEHNNDIMTTNAGGGAAVDGNGS